MQPNEPSPTPNESTSSVVDYFRRRQEFVQTLREIHALPERPHPGTLLPDD
jgi:hypothetical protein